VAKRRNIKTTLVAGLTALGHAPMESRARRYVMFQDKTDANYLYVGASGALRIGPNLKDSTPLGPRMREEILRAGA